MEKSLERVLAKESYDVIKKELYPIDNKDSFLHAENWLNELKNAIEYF